MHSLPHDACPRSLRRPCCPRLLRCRPPRPDRSASPSTATRSTSTPRRPSGPGASSSRCAACSKASARRVVYAGGVINATGRGHNVSLRINSQTATVDGQQQTHRRRAVHHRRLDLRPAALRLAGARRDRQLRRRQPHRRAEPTAAANAAPPDQTITPLPGDTAQRRPITLRERDPRARREVPRASRDDRQATFGGGTVDPNTVHVTFDGLDVTERHVPARPPASLYDAAFAAAAGSHTVHVTGNDSDGGSFDRSWSFTSGTSTVGRRAITNVRPAERRDGAATSSSSAGHTTPGAQVTVQVGVGSPAAGARRWAGSSARCWAPTAQNNSAQYNRDRRRQRRLLHAR